MSIKEVLEHPWLQKYCKTTLNSTECSLSLEKKMTGGMEFKIYSSPILEPKQNTNNILSINEAPLSNSSNSSQSTSNTLGLPLPTMNLPIYTNKNQNV